MQDTLNIGLQDSEHRASAAPAGGRSSVRRAAPRGPRAGFTLTELLIVIAIIAVLAGLVTAAAVTALRAAKRGAIVLEIKNVSGALEKFKTDYGSYPPSLVNPMPNATGPATPSSLVASDLERALRKAFPKHAEPKALLEALAGRGPNSGPNLQNGIQATEALYFWLGGFSSDERYPISGQGGPSYPKGDVEVMENRNRAEGFEFDMARLGPRNDQNGFAGRTLEYVVDFNGNGNVDAGETRMINLWQLFPKGSEKAYSYFDTSRHKPVQYDPPSVTSNLTSLPENNVYALKKLREGAAAANSMRDIEFVDRKFQILHPGLDDLWGAFGASATGAANAGQLMLFPQGPFIGENADTLTNFTEGELADAAEE
jgi:prepilin-type N-terminal cleavage/methylation domain-containing protein